MCALCLFLVSALLLPLGRGAAHPADCTASQKDLVPLDKDKFNINEIYEGATVSMDGVLSSIHSSQHFTLQVCISDAV